MTPIVFVDVETDGLHHGRRAWEIAMIRRDFVTEEPSPPPGVPRPSPIPADGGWWVEKERSFFVGIDLKYSDPYGLQVGGFWDRHPSGRKLSGKPPFPGPPREVYRKHDAAGEVMRLTFGATLVGVGVHFDAETLAGLLRAEGYLPSWHYALVDVKAMMVGWLYRDRPHHVRTGDGRPIDWPDSFDVVSGPPWKSEELSHACGVEPPSDAERHTALGDARWALRIYDHITDGGSS